MLASVPCRIVLTFAELVHENHQGASAQLYMHPDDPMSKPLSASSIKTSNVVLQVTVPKRTGLKRRRGELNPYHADMDQLSSSSLGPELVQTRDHLKSVDYLLRSLRDNAERYKAEPIGSVQITHRFRRIVSYLLRPCDSLQAADSRRYARLRLFNYQQSFHEKDEGKHLTI